MVADLVGLVPGGVIPWDHGFGAERLVPEAAMVGTAVPHSVERHEPGFGHLGANSERACCYPTRSSLPTSSSRSAMRPGGFTGFILTCPLGIGY